MGVDTLFHQLSDLFSQVVHHLKNIFNFTMTLVTGIISFTAYYLFPTLDFQNAIKAVIFAAFMDMVTKLYAISKQNGGFFNALIVDRLIISKSLWSGLFSKFIAYFTVFILLGVGERLIFPKYINVLGQFSLLIYLGMFFREIISNIENIIDSGYDFHWLLMFVRKKHDEVIEPTKDEKECVERSDKENEKEKSVY